MKKAYMVSAAAIIMMSCEKDELNDTDREFLQMAGHSNAAEIAAGQLAGQKGSNILVKEYGQQMVAEHTLELNELQVLGNDNGIAVPTTPDPAHQALMQRLMGLSGYDFDTAYMNSQIIDHQMVIDLYRNEADNGRRDQIHDHASAKLPNLNMHLQRADSIRAAL